MRHVSSTSVRSAIFTVLTRDTLVLLYLAVAVTEGLIFSLPLMSRGTLTSFGASPFEIPFVAVAALAGFYGLRRIQDYEERLFWSHLAYACVFWLTTLAAIAVVPAAHWRPADDMWTDAAYLLLYSPILFAAETKPHLAGVRTGRGVERQLRWAGVTLLAAGWYVYFVVAPVVLHADSLKTATGSPLLFMMLDLMIIGRYAWRAWSCGTVRWRVLYGMIALAGVALLGTDTLDLLEGLGVFALPDGTITDLLWAIAPFLLLVAFRLRESSLPQAMDPSTRERAADSGLDPVRVGSFLVGSAVIFPMVHFVLHTVLPVDPRLLLAHRAVVMVELLLLGALAAVAFAHLERQRLAAEHRRGALEERLRRARTLEAIGRVAGVVADEYTARLRVIGAFADRAIDVLAPGDPLRDEAVRAAEQAHRATDFTIGLRAISRQQPGQPARLDLSLAVSDRMMELRQLLGSSVFLEIVPAREPSGTMMDPAHLRVVLVDLVTNARDAMPNGGRCRIETGARLVDADEALAMAIRPGRYAVLTVRDTGSGIPKDVLVHLFEPFVSSKAVATVANGSGLGLATLYALVSQYGGCVNVTSEPGNTSFEILLPAA